MSTSSAVSIMQRAALTSIANLTILLSAVHSAAAQTPASPRSAWELRVTSGAFIPTGTQRNALADAQVTAAQLSWLARPSLAITGTFGWARSRDVASSDRQKLDVFTSDVGFEVRPVRWIAGQAVSFSPFAGMGAGVRSYNYRKLDVDATHNLAGYATAGGEIGLGRVGLRLEARDYATGFKPLIGAGTSQARNDVVLMGALRFNLR